MPKAVLTFPGADTMLDQEALHPFYITDILQEYQPDSRLPYVQYKVTVAVPGDYAVTLPVNPAAAVEQLGQCAPHLLRVHAEELSLETANWVPDGCTRYYAPVGPPDQHLHLEFQFPVNQDPPRPGSSKMLQEDLNKLLQEELLATLELCAQRAPRSSSPTAKRVPPRRAALLDPEPMREVKAPPARKRVKPVTPAGPPAPASAVTEEPTPPQGINAGRFANLKP